MSASLRPPGVVLERTHEWGILASGEIFDLQGYRASERSLRSDRGGVSLVDHDQRYWL